MFSNSCFRRGCGRPLSWCALSWLIGRKGIAQQPWSTPQGLRSNRAILRRSESQRCRRSAQALYRRSRDVAVSSTHSRRTESRCRKLREHLPAHSIPDGDEDRGVGGDVSRVGLRTYGVRGTVHPRQHSKELSGHLPRAFPASQNERRRMAYCAI